jgi:hypothetical protein
MWPAQRQQDHWYEVETATMTAVPLFPFAEYWWLYACFTVFVLGMLALDLGGSPTLLY